MLARTRGSTIVGKDITGPSRKRGGTAGQGAHLLPGSRWTVRTVSGHVLARVRPRRHSRGMSETAALSSGEYKILVEHSPVMIWRAGLDAKCDYFNQTWLAFTGRTLAEEIGEGWTEGVHPGDVKRSVQYYLDHFERREAFEMEYRLRRHDGTYRWLFDRGVPNFIDGRFVGFIGSCIEVEDRWQAQQALRHSLEREQEAREQAEALAAEVTAQCQSVEAMLRALQDDSRATPGGE